jgi:hypothetical protein
MKLLFLILFLCSTIIAAPLCYGPYAPAIDKVESIYKKLQYRHSLAFTDRYVYEIYPTNMFPFFVIPLDTLKKLPKYSDIYLCGNTIGINLDTPQEKRIQIAVLQYVKIGNAQPAMKTYTMYYFKWNVDTKGWADDRAPVSVVFYKQPDGNYWCK